LGAGVLEQLRGAAVDRDLGLKLGDPPTGGDELGVVGTGRAGQLTGVDQLLTPPGVDGLVADVEISGDLRDATAGSE
jgi:hypothetical protein